MRKMLLSLCLVVAASMTASAGSIPFSGSGSSGTIAPGLPFAYDFDHAINEPDWGVPGVGAGLASWSGPIVDQFTITFNLPVGISIDPTNLATTCDGGSFSGTGFCASPYTQPWNITSLTSDSITFTAAPGGNLLLNGDTFFVNVFFKGGDPNGVSFSGDWLTTVPEPGSFILFGSGILGYLALFRRKLFL